MFLEVNMKLSDYIKSRPEEKAEEKVQTTYEELKNLSNDELTSRLYSEVAKQKSNGTFDYNMLNNSIESIKGYMPTETYENIKRMLESLK